MQMIFSGSKNKGTTNLASMILKPDMAAGTCNHTYVHTYLHTYLTPAIRPGLRARC